MGICWSREKMVVYLGSLGVTVRMYRESCLNAYKLIAMDFNHIYSRSQGYVCDASVACIAQQQ